MELGFAPAQIGVERMQVVNKCLCEVSNYAREREVSLRREGNGDTAFGRKVGIEKLKV